MRALTGLSGLSGIAGTPYDDLKRSLCLSLWLNEASGPALDHSRDGRHFTAINSPGSAAGVSSATGGAQGARSFTRGGASGFTWTGTAFWAFPSTLNFWFRCPSFDAGGESLMMLSNGASNYLAMSAFANKIRITKTVSGGGTNTELVEAIDTDTWYMLTVLDAAADFRALYLNATTPATSLVSRNFTNFTRMDIGVDPFSNLSAASVDNLMVFNRALTAAELALLYRSGAGVQLGA